MVSPPSSVASVAGPGFSVPFAAAAADLVAPVESVDMDDDGCFMEDSEDIR